MRVITGLARGRRLRTLEGEDIRPTTEKVKEAVFSILQFEIEGRTVLDLFAGSGQMGIEALSREAKRVVFVDSSAKSLKVVKDNLETTGLGGSATVVASDFRSYLSSCGERFDIVFLDPPYSKGFIPVAMPLIEKLLNKGGAAVCETSSNEELPEEFGELKKASVKRYGKISVTIYRHKDVI
ncbi:MAG: 16S rRNA (guanine(966)-N(2))-methyltransferase RsmD [Oscillospiraceae bacterium]|nr:16S rRNA (guanine(966)-N(2))-methyltransferase RsmD [Oscillospiraceae bacterium]